MLAQSLSGLAGGYDLVIIDTPPGDALLQNLAMAATRWLLVPTKADASSITGLQGVARRLADVHDENPSLEVAGVVLFDAATTATRVRARAEANITDILGGAAPLFPTAIRSSQTAAEAARDQGKLVHELSSRSVSEALTADYTAVAEALLARIAETEAGSKESADEH